MKMTRWYVCGVLGTCSVLAALMTQPVQASDQKVYFKVDAGLSLVQDVKLKSGFDGVQNLGTLLDVYPGFGGTPGSVPPTWQEEWINDYFPGFDLKQQVENDLNLRPGGPLARYSDAAGPFIENADVDATISGGKFKCDPGFRVDLVGGYNLSETVALELEAGVLYNSFDLEYKGTLSLDGVPYYTSREKIKDNDLWQIPILLNGVYTFQTDSKFKPFLGVGVGGIFTIVDGDGGSDSDFTFAYQGMAGLNYELSECVDVGLAYKFLGTLDHKFGDVKTDPILSHSFLASLTWRF